MSMQDDSPEYECLLRFRECDSTEKSYYKTSGCEADIYFSCAINERTVVRSRTKECDKHGFVSIG